MTTRSAPPAANCSRVGWTFTRAGGLRTFRCGMSPRISSPSTLRRHLCTRVCWFHFARDRRRYLVTRALVRTVLSRYMDIAPREWAFAVNDYGRPLITNAAAAARQISFNVSHTDSLIILAIAQGHELGVDVENT